MADTTISTRLSLDIRLNRIYRGAFALALTIIAIHSISWWAHFAGFERIKTFRLLFDLDGEANIPAYFSALLILSVSICAWILHRTVTHKRLRNGWLMASALLFFLSWDEASQIHEKLNKSMHALLGGGDQGIFTFAWVIPYSVLVALVAVVMIPFIKELPRKLFLKLALAGSVYVSGAIGMEMIGAVHEFQSASYITMISIEESLEIGGMLLFLFFLLQEIDSRTSAAELRFVD